MGRQAYNKILFTPEMDKFLIENFDKMTNKQLADSLKLKITTVRTHLYELGYKRMELEYWTDEQVRFLKKHYKKMGDVELAEIFNDNWFKEKSWTKKHIEKKRRYMNLKRTDKEKKAIHTRNTKAGRFSVSHWKRWFGRERPVGEIVVWNLLGGPVKYIKTEFGHVKLSRLIWMQAHGEIPKGYNISHKDGDTMNCELNNLECLSNKDKAVSDSNRLSDSYVVGRLKILKEFKGVDEIHPELIEAKRQSIKLNRLIKTYEQRQD